MVVGLESWTLARPEIFLAAATLLLLVYGVVKGERSTPVVSVATSVVLLVTAVLLFAAVSRGHGFRLALHRRPADGHHESHGADRCRGRDPDCRAPTSSRSRPGASSTRILVALATLGMMLMISANDLMALYVGLELQSLALYVIAAFQRDNVRSTEAGVKYFVLGSVASGMLLFGASLIYGFCGGTAFVQISRRAARRPGCRVRHHRRPGVRGRRPRLQGVGRAVPHVDARRLRGLADAGDGAVRRGAQDRGHLADGLRPDGPVQAAVRAVAADHRRGLGAVDGAGRLRGTSPAEHQATDGLFVDRQRRLRAAGTGERHARRASRRSSSISPSTWS